MKRRDALKILGVSALAPYAASGVAATVSKDGCKNSHSDWKEPTMQKIALGDAHFQSRTNPTATRDQQNLEKLALELCELPEILKAKERAARKFKMMALDVIPDEALTDFDRNMDEWIYHYSILALNSDTNHPKVLHHLYGPPHQWFGMNVPGTRGPCTGENVDNTYGVIPVDGHSRYELHGLRMNPATGDCPIHVAGNLSMSINISALGIRDTEFNDDGSFVISVGPEPSNGRKNHLQTAPDARYIFIHDGRMDWDQIPSAFQIHRLDPPTAPELSVEQRAQMAARFIHDEVAPNFWFKQLAYAVHENTLTLSEPSDFFGGQPSQRLCRGHIRLKEDEAFVFTVEPGGAQYFNVILHDWWLMTLNYWDKQSTMNNVQAAANEDGSYTFVISINDPGIYNWLDTNGLEATLLLMRFQLLPYQDGTYGGEPRVKGSLVKHKNLDSVLSSGVKRISAEERKKQLADRYASFLRRFEV